MRCGETWKGKGFFVSEMGEFVGDGRVVRGWVLGVCVLGGKGVFFEGP